jgi:hypothetical protein
VSGTKGTYARTTDGIAWSVGIVPGAEKLDFRDVEAFGGETTAYLLSAGPGDASRIYKTVDGGKSWAMQFKSADPAAFLDAIAFWDEKNGIALGDPVKGLFQVIVTADGGAAESNPAQSDIWPSIRRQVRATVDPSDPSGIRGRFKKQCACKHERCGPQDKTNHTQVEHSIRARVIFVQKPGSDAEGGTKRWGCPHQDRECDS